eukprot:gb/GFBE01074709.1/.p1 GENE.gb/GFBE01074709.1/~~gb/GFBE01074709.1/.p1  ORF type:complete len:1460 (+),score=312.37 gb/GFBE01074709.1/:1-4380(+)
MSLTLPRAALPRGCLSPERRPRAQGGSQSPLGARAAFGQLSAGRNTSPRSPGRRRREGTQGEDDKKEEVKVVVRLRPPMDQSAPLSYFAEKDDQTKLFGYGSSEASSPSACSSRQTGTTVEELTFSRVVGPREDTSQTFESLGLRNLIGGIAQGFQETVFAYGQTGSGKTHTILGNARGELGLLQLCTWELFRVIFAAKGPGTSQVPDTRRRIQLVCLEIKNDDVLDLLPSAGCPCPSAPASESADVPGTSDEEMEVICVKGRRHMFRRVTVWSYEEAMVLLRCAIASREVGSSHVNSESSRSHMVVRFTVRSFKPEDGARLGSGVAGSLTLVDLAGNERDSNCPNGTAINVSLTHLNRMLVKMQDGQLDESDRRQSALNMVLYEQLREDCGVTMIFCIHPERRYASSARSTLQMATLCRRIVQRKRVRRIEGANIREELAGLRSEATALTQAHKEARAAQLAKEEELQKTTELLESLKLRYEEKSKDYEVLRKNLEMEFRRLKDEGQEQAALVYNLEQRNVELAQRVEQLQRQAALPRTEEPSALLESALPAVIGNLSEEGLDDHCLELERAYRHELQAVHEAYNRQLQTLKQAMRQRPETPLKAPPQAVQSQTHVSRFGFETVPSSFGEPCSEPSMHSSAVSLTDEDAACDDVVSRSTSTPRRAVTPQVATPRARPHMQDALSLAAEWQKAGIDKAGCGSREGSPVRCMRASPQRILQVASPQRLSNARSSTSVDAKSTATTAVPSEQGPFDDAFTAPTTAATDSAPVPQCWVQPPARRPSDVVGEAAAGRRAQSPCSPQPAQPGQQGAFKGMVQVQPVQKPSSTPCSPSPVRAASAAGQPAPARQSMSATPPMAPLGTALPGCGDSCRVTCSSEVYGKGPLFSPPVPGREPSQGPAGGFDEQQVHDTAVQRVFQQLPDDREVASPVRAIGPEFDARRRSSLRGSEAGHEAQIAPGMTASHAGRTQKALSRVLAGQPGTLAEVEAIEESIATLARFALQGRLESHLWPQCCSAGIRVMHLLPESPQAQRDGAILLSELANKDAAVKEDIAARGTLALAVTALRWLATIPVGQSLQQAEQSLKQRSEACSACFRLLAVLCQRHAARQAHASELGALHLCLQCLARPELGKNLDAAIHGCWLLMAMCYKHPSNQDQVRAGGGVALVMHILEAQVSLLETTWAKTGLASSGGQHALTAMRAVEPQAATLCAYAAGFLACMAEGSDASRQVIYDGSGIAILLRALEACLQSPHVVANACVAVAHLAYLHEPSQRAARAQGGVMSILRSLLTYRGHGPVQGSICRAIAVLTEGPCSISQQAFLAARLPDDKGGETGAVALLIQALRDLPQDAALVTTACWALSNLVVDSPEAVDHICNIRGTETAVALLQTTTAHQERPCEYLCRLLGRIASGYSPPARRSRQDLRALGAVDALVYAERRHLHSEGEVLIFVREALTALHSD